MSTLFIRLFPVAALLVASPPLAAQTWSSHQERNISNCF